MIILLVAATHAEISTTVEWLEKTGTKLDESTYQQGENIVRVLVTGIGGVATAFSMGVVLTSFRPDLAINAGIAGAIDLQLQLGAVVHVVEEQFADLGVEQADGHFTDLFSVGLLQVNQPPFINKQLKDNFATHTQFLPKVHGISVNKVHGNEASIEQLRINYPDAQVESMEGAAFFYACLLAEVSFVEVRAISNYVEKRNRDNWKIMEAVANLNAVLQGMIA